MPLHFTISLHNVFHSNHHTHNYLSECNSHEGLKTCRTCEVFNIAEKYKPQLQYNKNDTIYIDIKWDSTQVIQEGYKTISWLLTHTAKYLFTDIMTSSADTLTPKLKLLAAHYYALTVHGITSDTAHTNPEN